MPHITYKVKSYKAQPFNAHKCDRYVDGNLVDIDVWVDLTVTGSFPPKMDPEALVGLTLTAEWDHVHTFIAHNVRIAHTNPKPTSTNEPTTK